MSALIELPSTISPVPLTAIDPSLSGTAMCSGRQIKEERLERFPTKNQGDDVPGRLKRVGLILDGVVPHLAAIQPKLILIEGYSMGSRNGRELAGELGFALRWHCIEHTPVILEVAPTTLKKFITGSGGAKMQKSDMKACIQKDYGRLFLGNGSDDLADAFGLYLMALAAVGAVPMTNAAQREAVAKAIEPMRERVEALVSGPAF